MVETPKPVPLDQAEEERQRLYKPLSDAMAGRSEPLEEKPTPVVDDGDLRAFVAAVLGLKKYTKTYTLFGEIKVTLADRTQKEDEGIRAWLDARPATDRDDWYVRMLLAVELVRLQMPGTADKTYEAPNWDRVEARAVELSDLPKPLYRALLDTVATFEEQVRYLTEAALQPDFWTAGGRGSPSKPAAPAV